MQSQECHGEQYKEQASFTDEIVKILIDQQDTGARMMSRLETLGMSQMLAD
ncbi:hypothetical protein [Bradyrhizobium sp. URHD0069]|uniref:hypothetical protein n=1 Tax=Bradyrhizobium sp. URHD0069 TaxID=1380355 RepID=UPI000AAA2376|nr:hypothetical protein [Bradyrhizobium sp. URHD0069]